MASKRAAERDIQLPKCADPERRKAAEADVFRWLSLYFPHKFTEEFTADRREMVSAILRCARDKTDQAIAAPRGDGKTTITECVTLYAMLTGLVKFPVIVGATGPAANRVLDNIKAEIEYNELLAADYPEVCAPVQALEGIAQRARLQTVNGERTRIEWSANEAVLPTIQGSAASGAILMCRGLDSAIRGINYLGRRPDLVIIDDPETRESAASLHQCQIREQTIDRDIAGLGGSGKGIGRLMLCTLSSRDCLSAKFTERSQKPSWNGKRFRLLVSLPERSDLWEEYMRLRQAGQESGEDLDCRNAHAFYVAQRAEMDAGAVVSNPERYDRRYLDDGTQREVSALQHCYNLIADRGWDSFATEYQNDPPDHDGPETSGITPTLVRSRLSGVPKGIVPNGTDLLTAAIDIGKYRCHWVVIGWQAGAIGYVVDYGAAEVYNADDERVGLEMAIYHTLCNWRQETLATPYGMRDGHQVPLSCVLIDSGYCDSAVYRFVRESGGGIWRAAKGLGQGKGMSPFRQPDKSTKERKAGEHWYASLQAAFGLWLFGLDSDYWKRFVHERFLTEPFDPEGNQNKGSLTLFGDAVQEHGAYAKHICAEVEKEEFIKGKGVVRYWDKIDRNNHWFDATYMACAGAAMCGISLVPNVRPRPATIKVNTRTERRATGHDQMGQRRTVHIPSRPGGFIEGMKW